MTPDEFDRFLLWLDPDRDKAGEIYERIRRKLIGFFTNRACEDPGALTDDTLHRVARRVAEGKVTNDPGGPLHFVYGVAKNVHLEYLRDQKKKQKLRPEDFPPPAPQHRERELACLDSCLEKLTPQSCGLITKYFAHQGQEKIRTRQSLADQLGIGMNALRIRVFRIQNTLRECVTDCVHNIEA